METIVMNKQYILNSRGKVLSRGPRTPLLNHPTFEDESLFLLLRSLSMMYICASWTSGIENDTSSSMIRRTEICRHSLSYMLMVYAW
jgi:hypothetical protein